jgi:UDP-glucose 4-epimerase
MKLLLTGGTGYIGSHAAVAFVEAGHQVVLYDNLSNSRADVVERVSRIAGQAIPFVQGDLRDTALLTQTLQTHGIDAVVHFAGLKAVGDSVADPVTYYAHNVQGSISLLQAMQATGVKQLIFSSSATVYGEPQYLPLDEAHPTGATNPYGRSKLHIEEMLADLCVADPAWRVACLRYFNPVGAHASGLIGEDPQGVPNNLMPFVAQVASGQRPFLRVFGNDYPTPDGTGVRDYIHVLDLVDGHAAALRFLGHHPGWHAINLGTGQGCSVLQMVRAFEQACGRQLPFQVVPRRPGDAASSYATAAKAKQLLGWQAHRSVADMCASTWNFVSAAVAKPDDKT